MFFLSKISETYAKTIFTLTLLKLNTWRCALDSWFKPVNSLLLFVSLILEDDAEPNSQYSISNHHNT